MVEKTSDVNIEILENVLDPEVFKTITNESQILRARTYNAIPIEDYDEQVASYDMSFQEAAEQGGSIYGVMEEMPLIIQAAHERRIEILDMLPIGEVKDKVCVDYGVGSWGFACIFPKLQYCRFAIGIDISFEAIQESARISASKQFPYGDRFFYLTSRGDDIKLKDSSIDIFFTGECIEHIENTEAFLWEIHRVLKPGGLLILTTPNADAYLYQIQGERYGIGPEHVGLMGYSELKAYLDQCFNVIIAKGFNGSFHHTFDDRIKNAQFAKEWASTCLEHPELATGVVVLAKRRDEYQSRRYKQKYLHHLSSDLVYWGPWKVVPLHKSITGRLALSDHSSLGLDFSGNGVIINFWSHDWSGYARVTVDGNTQRVNLYSPRGGFTRVCIRDLPAGVHHLEIAKDNHQDPRSHGDEVIFYQAVVYEYDTSLSA